MDDQIATLGHNRPDIGAALREDHTALLDQCDDALDAVLSVPDLIDNEDGAKHASDVIKDLTGCRKNIEAQRKAEKEPYQIGGKKVDGFFVPIRDSLDQAKDITERRLTIFERAKADVERKRREEEARIAKAEADRLAKEAADAVARLEEAAIAEANRAETEQCDMYEIELAAAIAAEDAEKQARQDALKAQQGAEVKAAEISQTRSAKGAVASLRTTWDYELLDDIRAVPLEAIKAHIPIAALEQAIRGFVKAGGRELPGVRIYEKTTAVVR